MYLAHVNIPSLIFKSLIILDKASFQNKYCYGLLPPFLTFEHLKFYVAIVKMIMIQIIPSSFLTFKKFSFSPQPSPVF